MQELSVKVAGLASVAFCLSNLLLGCAASDEELALEIEGEPEIAAQWVDEQLPNTQDQGGRNRCGEPLLPGQERNCRLGTRNYTVRAGKTMKTSGPVPLVIDLPSTLGNANQMLGKERFCIAGLCWNGIGSGWAAESDTPGGGFVVVVPERQSVLMGDEGSFLRQLVTELRRSVDVDLNRVYVSGISDGANVALDAGCSNAGVFAGISPNSGAGSCGRVARPIPVIAFASRQDLNYMLNANAAESAARANGCRGDARPWRNFDGNTPDAVCRSANGDPRATLVPCNQVRNTRIQPTTCKVWDSCNGGARVVLCDVAAANPHGIINVSGDAHLVYENASLLNTPSVAWRFFKEFR